MRLSITLLLIIGALFLNVQAQQQKLLAVEHDVAQVPREYFLTAYIFQDGNLIKKDHSCPK